MSDNNQMHLVNRTRKARFGWAMYDWANSVYNLVITTAIFPLYFHAVAGQVGEVRVDKSGVENAYVHFMGFEMKSITMMSIAFAIAYAFVTLVSPLLSAIADYSGSKKKFMILFCGIGSLSCSLMYFFQADNFYFGFWLFIIAAIGFAGGLIFNDAFLPEVSAPEDYDKTSAFGYSLGYIGSVLLLVFNLSMLLMPDFYFDVQGKVNELIAGGLSQELALKGAADYYSIVASRISFLSVGIWWFVFAQITFFSLKDVKPSYKPKNYILEGFRELKSVMRKLKELKALKMYLLSFFFFNMAVQTVMLMASSYGSVELKIETSDLITTILLIQLVAIPGAFLFAWGSKKIGNYKMLLLGLCVWICVCVFAAIFVDDKFTFFALGGVVGLIMGGTQSLARSTYSKLVPQTRDTASFFSFYQITDKVAVIFGTFTFGILSQWISTKMSIIALTAFFLVGGILLFLLDRKKVQVS